MATGTLTPEQFHRITRALADPNRYKMLRRIYTEGDQTCGSVLSAVPISPGTASHHLRELETADLIRVTRQGRFRLLPPRREVWEAYLETLRDLAPPGGDD